METPLWMERLVIKSRSLVKTTIRLLGIALICLGVFNMFLGPLFDYAAVAPYRLWGPVYPYGPTRGGYYIGDALVMCVGAAIAWFT